MKVLLAFGGLRRPGGITPDLRNLELGLRGAGVDVSTAASLPETLTRLHRDEVDVVHAFGCLPSATIFGSIAAGRASRRRVVWTPVFHPNRIGYWHDAGRYRFMAAFDRVAVRAASLTDAVVAATPAEATYFRSVGARRCEVNPPVVRAAPGALRGAARSAARRRLGLGEGPVVLLVAAHSARRKGLDVASAAIALLRREHPESTLLLVGGGDPGPLGDQPGIVAAGWLAEPDLEAAYGCADLLLVPSRYEQFSRATLEAWAHELPVVLSDGVALAAVADGVAGIVVPFGDATATAGAMARLLRDPSLAGELALAGLRLAQERYELHRHTDQMVRLYEELCGTETDRATLLAGAEHR